MKLEATKRAIAYALRACMRIGELSRELEKATGGRTTKEILLIATAVPFLKTKQPVGAFKSALIRFRQLSYNSIERTAQ